jgi:hypothetical protein
LLAFGCFWLLAFQTEILIEKLMQNKRRKFKQKLCKIQQNLTKPWHFEKAKQLAFTPGLKQMGRLSLKMMTDGEDS